MSVNSRRKVTDGRAHLSLVKADAENPSPEAPPAAQPTPRILIVDDEPLICQQLERLYTMSGYEAVAVDSVEAALRELAKEDIDLVVTDVRLDGLSGVDLIAHIQKLWPDVPVVVMTGYADIETAVEVLKLGANDYLIKPFSAAAIQESTKVVLEKSWAFIEIRHLRRTLKDSYEFSGMLSRTKEMHRVFEVIRQVSGTDVTVVVEGETGTGKELVASAIHHQSPRRNGPFIPINCAGIPETLLESELFGCERGAFTGADQPRSGKLELANGGTLFLDEIESMPLAMQAKLLLALQNRKIQRLGGSKAIQVDMRVIAASNVPLKSLVAQGQMRSDFYYRINVVPIRLLPLRHRREDIPLLVQNFFRHHPAALRRGIKQISFTAMEQLLEYPWPGNIRELQNVLERTIVLATGKIIEKIELPEAEPVRAGAQDDTRGFSPLPLREWLKNQERQYLIRQLAIAEGRVGVTARNCGMDIKTLYRKMRFHDLDKNNLHAE